MGPKGVGKSTLIKQYIKQNFQPGDRTVLYCSADTVDFSTRTLVGLAEEFHIQGGELLAVDEIHKYKPARIPNTKIFITPGNHDPYLKNSYYATHEFGENVFVFNSSNVEKYEDENVNIYGMAFTDFYMNSTELESITVPFSNKLNILVAEQIYSRQMTR